MWWPFKRRKSRDSAAAKVIEKILALGKFENLEIASDGTIFFTTLDGKRSFSFFKPKADSSEIVENKTLFGSRHRDVSWRELDAEELEKLVLESLCGSFAGLPATGLTRFLRIPPVGSVAELGLKLDIEAGSSTFIIKIEDLDKWSGVPKLVQKILDSTIKEIP